jgi:hypothetical protein
VIPPLEIEMSVLAKDLLELRRLAQGGAGALTEHLLKEVARNLIAPGVASVLGGL